MAKKKKTMNAKNSGDPCAVKPALPGPGGISEVLDWCRERLSGVFSPVNLAAALDHLPQPGRKGDLYQNFARLAGPWLVKSALAAPAWKPSALLLDSGAGRLYAAGAGFEGLGCFDAESGKALWSLPPDTLGRAGGLALADGSLYVCDRWRHLVLGLDPDTGAERLRIGHSEPNKPLDEPSDILTVSRDGAIELWICERGGHRICRFSPEGIFLGSVGTRGLLLEETVQRFTRPAGEPENLCLEFPESLDMAEDVDGKESVFIWDSFNGRLVVLGTDRSFKRSLRLVPPGGAKFAGQVRVFNAPGGMLVLGIDDYDNCLQVWDAEGTQLLRLALSGLTAEKKPAEILRFVRSEGHPLLADNLGRMFQAHGLLCEPETLISSLVALMPERADLWLSQSEHRGRLGRIGSTGNAVVNLPPENLIKMLVDPGRTLDRGLARIVDRLERVLGSGAVANPDTLQNALDGRLIDLAQISQNELMALARPPEKNLDSWSRALTDLDMALVQTKGRNQQAELELDDVLEEIRRHPDQTRHTAWTLRELTRLLHALGVLSPAEAARRFVPAAVSLLNEKRNLVSALAGKLELEGEPIRIRREELLAIHRTQLQCSSFERVADHLADCLAETSSSGLGLSAESLAPLETCAALDGPGGRWSSLLSELGHKPATKRTDALPAGDALDPQEALRKFHVLIGNMSNYLKNLNDAGGTGGPFGRVVARQREIFALKGSLLYNALFRNGSTPAGARELAGQAGRLAGVAWEATANLRRPDPAGVSG